VALAQKTFGRLSLYRHILDTLLAEGTRSLFSHELARLAGVTAAQVRRDLMPARITGSPTKGYEIRALVHAIGGLIDARSPESAVLVGIGNLGRAILAHFHGRNPKLSIVAAFDDDPTKVNRILHGTVCYPLDDLPTTVRDQGIRIGIVTVPAAAAQTVADLLVQSGVTGLLNFAPARLQLPANVYLEEIDFGMSLEKVAYYTRGRVAKGGR